MKWDLSEVATRELAQAENALAESKDRLDRLRSQIAGYGEKGITTPHGETLLGLMGHSYELQARHVETLRREVRMKEERQELERSHVQKLNQRETRLQEALAAGSVMAFDWDASTGLIQRSNNAAQLLGYDPQQGFDAKAFQARVHPDDLARLKAFWSNLDRDNPRSIIFRFLRSDGREIWLQETSKAEFDAAGRLVRHTGAALDVTERIRAEQHQKILIAELDHRVKNVLARVIAVADSTRHVGSIDEFMRSFTGRIQSMAAAHTLLSQTGWQGSDLAALLRSQLAPYATNLNTTTAGKDIVLDASAAQAVALVIHELVTNAVKYGALSMPSGRVSVTWERKPKGNGTANLIVVWRERDGPPVAAATHFGYGTSLIRELIPHELGGGVDFVLASGGVCCQIEIPSAHVISNHRTS